MSSGVLESKRTIAKLIIQTALKISFGGGTDKYLKSDASGNAVWADLMPQGTRMLFYQASAPIGWITNPSYNTLSDYFLRIVTVGSGSGGSFTGSWTAMAPTVNPHASHVHSNIAHAHTGVTGGFVYDGPSGGPDGTGQKHHHTIGSETITIQSETAPLTHTVNAATHGSAQHAYANIIICEKA